MNRPTKVFPRDNVEKPPPYPSGLVDRTKDRIVKIWKNMTIEPAMFLIAFSGSIDNIATSQMVLIKSCLNDFDYNDTLCYDLESYPNETVEVSKSLNQFNAYKSMVTSIFPAFFAFYLGAWADLFGRKPLFYLFMGAKILEQGIIIGCAYFFETPKEWLFLSYIPTALSGGFAVWMLAINAFISDITEPENRAFRYGMLHLSYSLASPGAAPFGAYLLRTGGFVCVFSASLAGTLIGTVYLLYSIHSYKWNPPKSDKKKRSGFSPLLILDAFTATFRKRKGPNRKYLLVLIGVTIFTILPFFGEFTIAFSYVRVRYNWGVDEYSTYSSINSVCMLVASAVFIPLVALLKVNEAWIMAIIYLSTTVRHVVKGFASEPWMYYLGAMIDVVGSYGGSITRSMLSCCVAADELGKVYALISALDNLLPIGISQAYATIFDKTIETVPGTPFFISAGISGIALVLSFYVLISLKGKRMSDVTAEGAGRNDQKEDEKETDENEKEEQEMKEKPPKDEPLDVVSTSF